MSYVDMYQYTEIHVIRPILFIYLFYTDKSSNAFEI